MSKNKTQRRGRLKLVNILAIVGLVALVWVVRPAIAQWWNGLPLVVSVQSPPAQIVQPPAPADILQVQPPAPAVYQDQVQPGLTDSQAAAIKRQLAVYQTKISQTAEALDYCLEVEARSNALVNLPCEQLEVQLKRLMAGQHGLHQAAAAAAGQ